jgi:hypothetical protein
MILQKLHYDISPGFACALAFKNKKKLFALDLLCVTGLRCWKYLEKTALSFS